MLKYIKRHRTGLLIIAWFVMWGLYFVFKLT